MDFINMRGPTLWVAMYVLYVTDIFNVQKPLEIIKLLTLPACSLNAQLEDVPKNMQVLNL